MCLVPCMRRTCKGKVQSACCLMNVFPFLSLLVMCFQKTTMWKVGAFYFFSRLSFAFYFLVLTEYISNIDGKLNFFLSICWSLDCVSLFISGTHTFNPISPKYMKLPLTLSPALDGCQHPRWTWEYWLQCSVWKMIQSCFFYFK